MLFYRNLKVGKVTRWLIYEGQPKRFGNGG
jgi:hypothetical protein